MPDVKHAIAARAAQELCDGDVVNLGVGIPTLVANYVPNTVTVHLHTENGLLGVGPSPSQEDVDPDLINAGKVPVTEVVGSSFFSSADSFAMIRGGHIDVAILGALQVDEQGRVANWTVPGKPILGVGGAMDLLVGARKVIVTMTHTAQDGTPKLVKRCTLPVTAERRVNFIVTDLAVFEVRRTDLALIELQPGAELKTVQRLTDAHFLVELQA
ncbi:3-oxoacid CoA-transferase subunit B [Alicyclobacillus sp. ALC3]|nr:3-oxoacid CoA-transferase subunit B [Alicyclobacillus sp. ALC3]WDL95913.1 3-oxoacid CoA-transferase subunit B [Alicyclobacillus sp. ALC3]